MALKSGSDSAHGAVKAYFEQEKELYKAHDSSITFQVYRINLQANSLEKLQGQKLTEVEVNSNFVSGDDTVAAVKIKVRSLLERQAQSRRTEGEPSEVAIEESEHITLYFDGNPMQDDTAFYADNFIMLPAWVQVLLHHGESEEVVQLMDQLRDNRQEGPSIDANHAQHGAASARNNIS